MIRGLAVILLAAFIAGSATAQSGPARWNLVMDHPNFVTVFARVAPARVAGVAERDVLLVYPASINFLDHGRSRWSIDCGNNRMKRQGAPCVAIKSAERGSLDPPSKKPSKQVRGPNRRVWSPV